MVWVIIQILFSTFFAFPLILLVISKIKKGGETRNDWEQQSAPDYGIIVTAYQQTDLIPNVVGSLLQLNYENYIVYIVADNCDITTLNIEHPKVIILRPEKVLASNTKSHFYAINRFVRNHDIVTIIDSDNLVDQGYINELNEFFNKGFSAVQGVRKAKNLDTMYACLDEAGDIYYRFIDRKILFGAGSSASLAGSGMAFTTKIFKESLAHLTIEGAGFDKVLQYELLRKNERIAFAEKAIVYDEKTSKSDQLVKQRARWINTWFRYCFLGFKMFLRSLRSLNWNQFAFSVLLMRPPLFLMLITGAFFFIIDIVIAPIMALYWVLMSTIFVVMFFISLKYFKAAAIIYKSLKYAPKFIFYQILAFLKIRKANKISVATEHYSIKEQ